MITIGSYGTRTIKYKITYEDDVFVSKEQISDEITKKPIDTLIAIGTMNVWRCTDATSYDKNPYNDNYCEDSYGNSRYVSDSEARILDSDYVPGRYGHPYYNSF